GQRPPGQADPQGPAGDRDLRGLGQGDHRRPGRGHPAAAGRHHFRSHGAHLTSAVFFGLAPGWLYWPAMADPNIVLGIDLGTTNSACAVVQDGRASVVRRGEDRIVPSVIAALPNGQIAVGREAKLQRAIDPSQVVYSAKRLIGRHFSSPEVQRMMRSVPYRIVEGKNESVMIEVGARRLSVVEISSLILKYLRQMAEEALG